MDMRNKGVIRLESLVEMIKNRDKEETKITKEELR